MVRYKKHETTITLTIFKLINEINLYSQENVKNPYGNTIKFFMGSNNIRTLNSYATKSDLISKWANRFNKKKINIFKNNSKDEMIVCGTAKLIVNIDSKKLLAAII